MILAIPIIFTLSQLCMFHLVPEGVIWMLRIIGVIVVSYAIYFIITRFL